MARTGSTVSLSKFNVCIQKCDKCKSFLDTSQKPIHETLILNPSPILFVLPYANETDITTSQYLTSPGGIWLSNTMDQFISRKYWTVHSLIMCSLQGTTEYKDAMHNCFEHYARILEVLVPSTVVFLGVPDKPAFKKYKVSNSIYLGDPNEFVPQGNRLAMSRFKLTIRKLCDEKTALG